MQSIFNQTPTPQRGSIFSAQWNTARSGLSRNLAQVEAYFHSRSMAVKNNHILVKLLGAARLNYEAPIERFYERIDVMTPALAQSFGLTCPVAQGQAHDGPFYGKGTKEVLIASTETFDVHEAFAHWQTQSPVKVIYHEKSDLEMHIPNGMPYSSELGVAVVCINVPMLFVMYRGFMLEQLQALRRGQQAKVAAQFVHSYVLPNMIASHLDFALFNRAMMLASGQKVAAGTARKHAIGIANWTSQTDKVLVEITGHLQRTNYSLHDMLCSMPAVTCINGAQTMQLPGVAEVYQYAWVELLARARVVASCIFISPNNLLASSSLELMKIDRAIAYEGGPDRIKAVLGVNDAQDTLEVIDLIQKVAKTR